MSNYTCTEDAYEDGYANGERDAQVELFPAASKVDQAIAVACALIAVGDIPLEAVAEHAVRIVYCVYEKVIRAEYVTPDDSTGNITE